MTEDNKGETAEEIQKRRKKTNAKMKDGISSDALKMDIGNAFTKIGGIPETAPGVRQPRDDTKEDETEKDKKGGQDMPDLTGLQGTMSAGAEFTNASDVPISDFMTNPEEVVDYMGSLDGLKEPQLRQRLTKVNFQNQRNRQWINHLMSLLKKTSSSNLTLRELMDHPEFISPPTTMTQDIGAKPQDDGTEVMAKLMKTIAPYMMMRDLMKEGTPEDAHKTQGENVTVEIGGNKITGSSEYIQSIVPFLLSQTKPQEPTRDEGTEQLMKMVMDMQKELSELRMAPQPIQEQSEKMMSIPGPDGTVIEIPVSQYSNYLLTQQMQRQQTELMDTIRQDREQRGNLEGTSQNAQMMAVASKMSDAMAEMRKTMDPTKVGEMAMHGLRAKADEMTDLRHLFGSMGGGTVSDDVAMAQLKQDAETHRHQMSIEAKQELANKSIEKQRLETKRLEALMAPRAEPAGTPSTPSTPSTPTPVDSERALDVAAQQSQTVLDKMLRKREDAEEER